MSDARTLTVKFYDDGGEEYANLRIPNKARGVTVYAGRREVEIGWSDADQLWFIELDGQRILTEPTDPYA